MKDRRYNLIKKLILNRELKTLSELIEIIKETNLKNDLKTHSDTLKGKLNNPSLFSFEDAFKIAALVEVDEKLIVDLIYAEHLEKKKVRKK